MATSYANPGGSGDRTAQITVSLHSITGSGSVSDIVDGTQSNEFFFTGISPPGYIQFDFGSSSNKIIDGLKWYQDTDAGNHGNDWSMDVSSDGSSWTAVHGPFEVEAGTAMTETTWTNTLLSGRYWRLYKPAGSVSSTPYIREVEFRIDDVVPPLPISNHGLGVDMAAVLSTIARPRRSLTIING